MNITIAKEPFKDTVSVGVVNAEVAVRFEDVRSVYVGSRSDSAVSFRLCRHHGHIGGFTVSVECAEALIAQFKGRGVYTNQNPFELSVA